MDNYTRYKSVYGSDYTDAIYNYAGGAQIYGYGGNDYIYNSTRSNYTINSSYGYVTVYGGDGNDTVYNNDPYVYISGGSGADSIKLDSSFSKYVTVYAGTGNDIIYDGDNYNRYWFYSGDGYDTIYNWSSTSTLYLGGAYYTRSTVGSNVVISLTSGYYGAITLNGASGKTVNITNGTLVNNMKNYNKNSLVSGSYYADTIYNYAGGVKVYGYGGNDYIYNYTTDGYTINNRYGYVTLDGGDGADTIYSYDPRVSISGGSGNDSISVGGDCVDITITGGTGNDIIRTKSGRSEGILYQYKVGDGYDTIYNWSSNDTITLVGGTTSWATATSGDDVYVSVGGSRVMTLVGAKGKEVNIYPIGGRYVNNYTKYGVVSGSDYADTINNYAGGAKIYGYGGDDYIYNITYGSYTINGGWGYVTLDGGAGNDTIKSYDPRVSLSGGAGADLISIGGGYDYVTIFGGTGNDKIYGDDGSHLYQFRAGDGYDTIYNWNSNDTITIVGGGNYTRSTVGSNVVVSMSGGAMTLEGASNKTVRIYGGTLIDTNTSGARYLTNYTKNSVINGSSYADTVYNYAGGVKVYGNGGNDYISNITNSNYTINSGWGYVSLDGGAGNDTIKSYDPRVSLSGGAGADLISVGGGYSYVTINGGEGNDIIYGDSGAHTYQFRANDGYDVIYNWNSNDIITLVGGGNYTRSTVGSNVVVSMSGGAMTLSGAKGKTVKIYGGTLVGGNATSSGGLNVSNYNRNSLVSGSTYADTIYNYAGGVTVRGGGGNDYLSNNTKEGYTINNRYGYVTLDGGDGADTIYSYDPRVSISGGVGNDSISLSGNCSDITVNGGTGNDIIRTASERDQGILYQYKIGDGYDTIYNYSSKDSITITGGTTNWATTSSGDDVYLSVSGSRVMTLVGAKGKTLNIYPATTPTPTPTPTPTSSVSPQEVIKKFMKALDSTDESGVGALNTAVQAATNNYFNSINSVMERMCDECKAYNDSDRTNGWKNFLLDKCGINLTNSDTGAIIGYDAGGSTVEKTPKSIINETTSIHSEGKDSFKIGSTTVKLASVIGSNIYDSSYSNIKNSTVKSYIWRAVETWWAKGALDIVSQSYGTNYNIDNKTLYVGFFDKSPDSNGYVTLNYTSSLNNGNYLICININENVYGKLENGGNSDGKIKDWDTCFLDRVFAHEMTHATMMNKVTGFSDLPQFIKEGTAELVHGIDDDRTSTITALAKNSTSLYNNLNLNNKGTGNIPMYAAGYMFLRYLAKQGSEHYSSSNVAFIGSNSSKSDAALSTGNATANYSNVVNGLLNVSKNFDEKVLSLSSYDSAVKKVNAAELTKGIMIVGNKNASSITAGQGNDSVFANTGNDTINGGTGNDMLYGEAGNDIINGGAGNDSLYGGSGSDTLTGGDGADIFVYVADTDTITDYTPGKDKIKLSAVEMNITDSKVSNSDVTLTVGLYGSIVVKNGANKKITIVDGYGKTTNFVYGGSTTTTLTVTDSAKSPAIIGAAVKTVDASSRTKALTLTANTLANSIVGSSGKDSINGLDGNDTILGGKGNDVLIGGAGNDSLNGAEDNDTLNGGSGNDILIGGAGNDSLNGAENNDTLNGGSGNDILIGGAGNDSLRGYTGNDKLNGGSGNDILLGEAGNDSLFGYTGNDILNGGAGDDTLRGGAGNDSLNGGAGNDSLWGDAGNDKFFYKTGDGKDVIFGFENNDLLQITGTFNDPTYNASTKSIAFKVGDGSIMLKDFGSTTLFHVNSSTYQLSNGKLSQR